MMNRQAQAWGLKNTQFKNVTGLTEPGHYSSARDVAVIAARSSRAPEFYALYALRKYTYNNIKQDNRNMLLGRDPSVDGMKTGYTESRRLLPGGQRQREPGPTASAGCSAWCWAPPRARRAPPRARSC
jgi:serine-type D-Ala-D-Ala carboxypeptidase (penicillin-binding protein 5/6)